MDQTEFIKQLRATAAEIELLTKEVAPGATVWNGKTYVKSEPRKADPYALSWWSILSTIADMIEVQETSLSAKQLEFLQRLLFGGMGSLNDLYFDPKSLGTTANKINERLDQKRHALFAAFATKP